jgi:hypothetical protein
MPRPTLTTIALSMAASFATLLLALAPALGPAAVPGAPQDALRVAVLGVGIHGAGETREPRTGAAPVNAQAAHTSHARPAAEPIGTVALPRVVVAARRAVPAAAGGSALQPVMQRRGL